MILTFLLLSLVVLSEGCELKKENSYSTESWKIHSATMDYIHNGNEIKSVAITDSRLTELFSKAVFKKMKENQQVIVKGEGRTIVLSLVDGEKIILKAYNAGGFFIVEAPKGDKGYYYFPDRKDYYQWHDLFFGEGLRKFMKES